MLYTLVLLALIGAINAQQTPADSCSKLQDCIQIAHDQVQECRRLMSSSSSAVAPTASAGGAEIRQQCETDLKAKQTEFLEKLLQKGSQLKQCIADKPASDNLPAAADTGSTRAGRRRGGKKGNQQDCTSPAATLKPVKTFGGAETARHRGHKHAAKQSKQCLQAVQQAKNQCKQLLKCCPAARTCMEEMKSSPIETELKTLQKALADGKKKCKGGAGRRAGGRARGETRFAMEERFE